MRTNLTGIKIFLIFLLVLEAFGFLYFIAWKIADPTLIFVSEYVYTFGLVIPGTFILTVIIAWIIQLSEARNGVKRPS